MLLSRYNCFHWNILEETYIKGAIYLPNICQQMAMKVYTINHHHTQQLTDELTGGACPPHWPHTGLPHSAPPKWAFNRVPLHFKYLTDWLFFYSDELLFITLAFHAQPMSRLSLFPIATHVQTRSIPVVQAIPILHAHEQHARHMSSTSLR